MLVEGGPGWSGRENLWMLESSRLPLGVECIQCQHRALVPFQILRRCGHDMTPIKSLPLVCRCGSRDWRDHLPPGGRHGILAGFAPVAARLMLAGGRN
jgi:hypothetical protein